MQKIKGLLTSSTFFLLVTCIEAAAPFLLAPLLTRYLSLYEYGLWGIFQSASAFLRPVIGLSLDDYIRIHYHRNDRKFIIQLLLMTCAISALMVALALCVSFLWGTALGQLLVFPPEKLWAIIFCAWLYALFYLVLTYHQFAGNKMAYAVIHVMQASVTLGSTILLVVLGYGWLGAVTGKLLGLSCCCILGAYYLKRERPELRVHLHHLPRLISFGISYLPSSLLAVGVIAMDRIMLAHMAGMEASSFYVVASLFPSMLLIAVQGFLLGWQPWCFGRLTQRPVPLNEIGVGALFYMLILPVGAVILYYATVMFGPLMIGKTFLPALHYVPMLIAGAVALGYYTVAQSILQYYQKIRTLSLIACLIVLIKIVLNYMLIPVYGVNGVGLSTAIVYGAAFLVTAAMGCWLIQKHARS